MNPRKLSASEGSPRSSYDCRPPPLTTLDDPRGLLDHRDEVRGVIVERCFRLVDQAPVSKPYLLLA